ncbi:hypothetical protein [Papillibacter cinnamivorans]|uniref:Portal protein n=1 Tax=Papillibacter cinnamivorans DSM 12816 TaxID=1122930 RepID=A0A1W1YYD0_9FIRM|nr:hypothetical protein [Papillibacter cinnamivorans]SMC41082.1 hypothetical protein SAMN02745168_0770 [Papillibacter cinnamivorans DSM 12816]
MPETRNDPAKLWAEYKSGMSYKQQIGLYDTVAINRNFYIGRQWEGVEANGLPTPSIPVLKLIVRHQIAAILSDNIKMIASPFSGTVFMDQSYLKYVTNVISSKFEQLFEFNFLSTLLREYVTNAEVDGDACLYSWFDPDIETGQWARGDIVTEIVENSRVVFGNPNDRRVQKQPWIMIARRMVLEDAKREAKQYDGDEESIVEDTDETNNYHQNLASGKCTVVMKFWREYYTEKVQDKIGNTQSVRKSRIMAEEFTAGTIIRKAYDTGLKLYPITWFSIDNIPNSYHGQAVITGLIDDQIAINKMLAMVELSLTTTAFPKVIYDGTRIAKWDNRVGGAIKVIGGGDVRNAAAIINPATIDSQIYQFINFFIDKVKEMLGATSAALGEAKAYNTSALVANQRASAIPHDVTRTALYQSIEDLGRIYMDLMRVNYGERYTMMRNESTGVSAPAMFDFSVLNRLPLSIKLDVGASSYWSEITTVQTLGDLLTNGKIELVDYLDRLPEGIIPQKQELIDKINEAVKAKQDAMLNGVAGGNTKMLPSGGGNNIPIPSIRGNSELQRAVLSGAKVS